MLEIDRIRYTAKWQIQEKKQYMDTSGLNCVLKFGNKLRNKSGQHEVKQLQMVSEGRNL